MVPAISGLVYIIYFSRAVEMAALSKRQKTATKTQIYFQQKRKCKINKTATRISRSATASVSVLYNKKHLKNVGPIRHCEPPHAHSPGVATGTVARRRRIDVHDNNNDNA